MHRKTLLVLVHFKKLGNLNSMYTQGRQQKDLPIPTRLLEISSAYVVEGRK